MKKHLPNLITLLNLLCGSLGIVFIFKGAYEIAVFLVFAGLLFDFMDGFVARLLKVSSELGAQLDSLSDLVSFGLFPTLLVFDLLSSKSCEDNCTGLLRSEFIPYLAFIMVLASAYRLAKFNVDTEQSYHFKGIPTPINALLICSLPFMIDHKILGPYLANPKVIIGLVLVQSYLLVADRPFLALKFKDYSFKSNWNKYMLLLLSIISIVFFTSIAIPIIYVFYILLSLFTIPAEVDR